MVIHSGNLLLYKPSVFPVFCQPCRQVFPVFSGHEQRYKQEQILLLPPKDSFNEQQEN